METHLVKSAVRVFEILELFDLRREPLRLKDITAALNHPVSSMAALLKSMVAQGYLNFDNRSRAYLPTPRLARLGSWVPFEDFEQGVVMDTLRHIQKQSGELAVLAVEDGIHLVYEQTLNTREGIQLTIAPGTRRLLVQTGTGWLFLNLRSRVQALEVYDRTIAAGELDPARFSRAMFLERLADHARRKISYVRARDLVMPTAHWGGGMVSALIPAPAGHRPLALGVGGPADRLEAHMGMIETLLEGAIKTIADHLPGEA
ncbi:MAG: helix-turn-helix domain-containing protein [Alphaproteobacteria bacterium]|nr:helix-turn-helix domain-containing protein [Alphaproteobacteria bacterium]